MKYYGKITDPKDLVTKEWVENNTATDIEIADGSITRNKLALDALIQPVVDISTNGTNQLTADMVGKLVRTLWISGNSYTLNMTADVFSALPDNATIDIISGAIPTKFTWSGIDCRQISSPTQYMVKDTDTSGSYTFRSIELIRLRKYTNILFLSGYSYNILSGTDDPTTDLGSDGDVYFKYTE